jgi:hypothetical protein
VVKKGEVPVAEAEVVWAGLKIYFFQNRGKIRLFMDRSIPSFLSNVHML